MLANIRGFMTDAIKVEKIRLQKPKAKPKTNVKSLKEKLRRLNVMYMAGGKTDEEYVAETKALNEAIAKAENEVIEETGPNIDYLNELLNSDFETLYATFSDEEKQVFWTKLIREIRLDGRDIKEIVFF